MSKLTLDEAIKHCLEVAEQNDAQAEKWREEGGEQWGKTTVCRECAADHRQLAEWLMELKDLRAEQNDQYTFIRELMDELKEAKRLLKAAVNDMKDIADNGSCNHCIFNSMYAQGSCCMDGCYKWRYVDEAENLLNDEK